jgi:pyocin large subunit-like protein
MTPAELRAIGEALYGPVWQTKLARVVPANVRTVRRWLSGKSPVRPVVAARIRALVKECADE